MAQGAQERFEAPAVATVGGRGRNRLGDPEYRTVDKGLSGSRRGA